MSEQQPPQPPQQPPQPPWTPPPGGYPHQAPPPTPSSATTALILGILGLVFCGPFTAIPALIIGKNSVKEIDDSQGRLGGRSTAQAGYILGIIGTVISVLAVLFVIAVFAFGALWFNSVDCTSSSSEDGQDFHFQCN